MSVDSDPPPLIAHIIYTLSTGGMENGLVNIINRMPAGKYRHLIICLTEADNFARRITADGVEIVELHMREGHDFDCYRRLRKYLKRLRPDIVHSRNIAALEAQLFTIGLSGLKRVHGEHGGRGGACCGEHGRLRVTRGEARGRRGTCGRRSAAAEEGENGEEGGSRSR